MERLWNIEGWVLWEHQDKVPLKFPLLVPGKNRSGKLIPSVVLASHDYRHGSPRERTGGDDLGTYMRDLHREFGLWIGTGDISASKIWMISLNVRVTVVLARDLLPLISSKMPHRKWGYLKSTNWSLSLLIMLSHSLNQAVVCCVGVELFSIKLLFYIHKQGVSALSVSLTLLKTSLSVKRGTDSFLLPQGTKTLGLAFLYGQWSSLLWELCGLRMLS